MGGNVSKANSGWLMSQDKKLVFAVKVKGESVEVLKEMGDNV